MSSENEKVKGYDFNKTLKKVASKNPMKKDKKTSQDKRKVLTKIGNITLYQGDGRSDWMKQEHKRLYAKMKSKEQQ